MRLDRTVPFVAPGSVTIAVPPEAFAQSDRLLMKDGRWLFPIGCYELPREDAGLKATADARINLVRCETRGDLDRAQAMGMMGRGW